MPGSSAGRLARFLTPALLAALLVTCGPREEPAPTQASTGETDPGTPRRGGTIVAGWTAEPGSANEYITPSTLPTNEVLFRVFQRLVEEQADFNEHPATFAPQLAESWEWSPDRKALTFRLRENLVWSDGVPLTAEDVRWTWQMQTHPKVRWDNVNSKDFIRDVEVVDPRTVRFHFTQIYSKQMLDANEGVILPKHAWSKLPVEKWRESSDWFKQNLVVSGPFTIASWTPQQELVMARNERYWEKDRPYLDRVVMRILPDAGSLVSQVLGGELDFIPQVAPTDVPRVKADPDLNLISYWSNLYVVVGWNTAKPLFADADVRRALTLAMDRQAIVDTILPGGMGRVAVSPYIQSVWAHDKTLKPHPFDLAEARRILAAAGWKDSNGDGILDRGGKPFSFELTSNAGNQQRNDAAVMIQQQLKKVGIDARPRILEFNTLVQEMNDGAFDAIIIGLSMDTSLDMTAQFHTRAITEGNNSFRYSNPEVDRLLEQVASQPELKQAEPYIHQIERLLHRDQPATFLWESQRMAAVNKRIRDAKPNQMHSFFNLKDWWLAPGN
jgi:peptide/nickel transport system substrate-binding protein